MSSCQDSTRYVTRRTGKRIILGPRRSPTFLDLDARLVHERRALGFETSSLLSRNRQTFGPWWTKIRLQDRIFVGSFEGRHHLSFSSTTIKGHFKADHYWPRRSSPRKSNGIREQNDSGKSHHLGRTHEDVSVNLGIPLFSITSRVAFSDKYKVYNSNKPRKKI